jgi:hypothetical protein
MSEKYSGRDNRGNLKKDYIDKLAAYTDEELLESCTQMIWLSAYANNNPRSDFHWQCDACYDECKKRNKVGIYESAYKHNTSN